MAKDDYFVVLYQILCYLYECLKKGQTVKSENISAEKFQIPDSYWRYILSEMIQQGLIQGASYKEQGGEIFLNITGNLRITTKGIEYLEENSMMNKAKGFFKDVKEMVPFW